MHRLLINVKFDYSRDIGGHIINLSERRESADKALKFSVN